MEQIWKITLTSYVDYLILPNDPEFVFDVATKQLDGREVGELVPVNLWEVEGKQWRYLGDKDLWPSGDQLLAMRAILKPLSKAKSPDFCTVPLRYLRPLFEAEVIRSFAADYGLSPIEAIQEAQALRAAAMATAGRMKIPNHVAKQRIVTYGAVPWKSWADEHITFGDLP